MSIASHGVLRLFCLFGRFCAGLDSLDLEIWGLFLGLKSFYWGSFVYGTSEDQAKMTAAKAGFPWAALFFRFWHKMLLL